MALLPVPGNCWTVKAFREHHERGPTSLLFGLLEALRQHDDVEFVAIDGRSDQLNRICELDIIRAAGRELKVRPA